VLRGIKTLPLRMRQHDISGRTVADWLTRHPKVARVYYPGLPDHPQHALAQSQATGFGGMISFLLADRADVTRFFDGLKLCALAESLGGVETLVCQPSTMTHASIPPEERERLGLTDRLARISVGCEDVEDIVADLDQALGGA
jgi:cystathionine beta-lyase/cystathionine gamma-synthase